MRRGSAPRVRLVVCNFNGGRDVLRCVEHLERLDWPEDRLEIVVVDNASSDGSDRTLESRPRVRLIRNSSNGGFPANNLALRDLDGVDFVGLVNSDAFVTPEYLAPLVSALEGDDRLGAVCPKIVLAPRFVDLTLTVSNGQVESGGDSGAGGVRVSGVRVSGEDRWERALVAEGLSGLEPPVDGVGPTSRRVLDRGVLRVPVDAEASLPVRAALRLSADRPGWVDVQAGDAAAVRVEVATLSNWVSLSLAGPSYDVINNAGSQLVDGAWGGDRGFLERDVGQYDEGQDVFAWCGAGVLLRPGYLRDVGLLDERFFLYYEDTDLAWRGRARGWRYRYVPEAVLRHVHAATSVEGSALFHHFVERNRLVMLTKNAPREVAARAVTRFVLSTASYARRDVARPLLRRHRPQTALVRARMRSFAAYLSMLPAVLAQRRRLRAVQQVPDEAITGWSVWRDVMSP